MDFFSTHIAGFILLIKQKGSSCWSLSCNDSSQLKKPIKKKSSFYIVLFLLFYYTGNKSIVKNIQVKYLAELLALPGAGL